jgi:hypothetical protein
MVYTLYDVFVEWRIRKRADMKECFERCKSGRDGIKEWKDGLKDTKVKWISIEPMRVRVSI